MTLKYYIVYLGIDFMTEEITTIKLNKKTKERLDHLKENSNETYDQVINKSFNILNICMKSPGLAAKILKDIEKTKKRKELIENPASAIRSRTLERHNQNNPLRKYSNNN